MLQAIRGFLLCAFCIPWYVHGIMGHQNSPLNILCDQLLDNLQTIHDVMTVSGTILPTEVAETVASRLSQCQGLINGLKDLPSIPSDRRVRGADVCDVLHELQQVIQANDAAFLQHHLTHHLRAGKDLPKACAVPEQVRMIAGELLAYLLQVAAKGSTVTMELREVPLKQGAGLECTFTGACPAFSEQDRYRLFEEFSGVRNNGRPSPFVLCRRAIEACHGQLWVEIPTKGKVALTFVIPCVRDAALRVTHARVKCDAIVTNYTTLRETYGTVKAATLLQQMEERMRRVIRAPLDAVAAFEPRGIVSTIMDLPSDAVEIVVDRLRVALNHSPFHIGRHPIHVDIDYQLTTLP